MEDEQLKSPFGDFFGNPPREFGSQGEDMFRHFDEMFQSFNEIFRSMGIADFPGKYLGTYLYFVGGVPFNFY